MPAQTEPSASASTALKGDLRVVPWLEDDDTAWDALCDRHDDLFQTSAVSRASDAFGARTRRVRIDAEDGTHLAAMAVVEVGSRKLPAADRLFARRFHVQGGPLPLLEGLSVGGLMPRAMSAFAASRGAVESDWKPTWPVDPASVDLPDDGWTLGRFGIAWRDLPEDAGDVLETLSRTHRKAVRRALREGLDVRPARDAIEVLDLVDRSFVRSGLTAPNREFLERLRAGLVASGRAIELVAEGPAGSVAALLAGRCGGTVFNLFHGRVDGDTQGASNLLHLRLFEDAVRSGARRVHTGDAAITDDGTTGTAGILRFKRHLGFRVDPSARAGKVHRPGAHRVAQGVLSAYRFLLNKGDPK